MSSVLDSIKKSLGIDATDTAFDTDITIFINSALSRVLDLGAGKDGVRLYIVDKNILWTSLFDDNEILQMIETFVYLSVKLVFDPPGTSFGIKAIEDEILKQEWLITSKVEEGVV